MKVGCDMHIAVISKTHMLVSSILYRCCASSVESTTLKYGQPAAGTIISQKEESSDESTIISSQTSTLTRNQGRTPVALMVPYCSITHGACHSYQGNLRAAVFNLCTSGPEDMERHQDDCDWLSEGQEEDEEDEDVDEDLCISQHYRVRRFSMCVCVAGVG